MDVDFLLIRKMKQGDDDAFDTFVRKYYDDILKYCSYHCSDAEYAEDLTQETAVNSSPEAQSDDIQENNKAAAKGQGFADIREMINLAFGEIDTRVSKDTN